MENASIAANNLAELFQTLGDLAGAEDLAQASVAYADQSGDAFQRMARRTTLADVCWQRGQVSAAQELFEAAEAMQADREPDYPLLYSQRGYRYCDLLLERKSTSPRGQPTWVRVRERASQTLEIAMRHSWVLNIALDHLTLGRAWLLEAEHTRTPAYHPAWTQSRRHLDDAVRGLRQASQEQFMPPGLIARAAWHRAQLAHVPESRTTALVAAQRDLDEAHDIAEGGPMRLHLTEIALERARLALATSRSADARAHLDIAKALIERTGYHRRDQALADLQARLESS